MTSVISMHGRRAARTPAHELDVIQLHGQAINGLSMALHYLRMPEGGNVPGATRKAVQALAALNKLLSGRA